MGMRNVAEAMNRAVKVLQRRPDMGLQDDAPATARWDRGMQIIASHANGTRITTDMPEELGGSGEHVTPGWLFRASLASCAATSIAMAAAQEDIDLTTLELRASSRSDARGLLGMGDESGATISAGPRDVELLVRICAAGTSAARLRALVETALVRSPIPIAVREPVSIHLNIEVGDH